MGLRFNFKRGLHFENAIDRAALWGQGADLIDSEVHAGVPVSQSTALRVVAVYACVRLRSETIAALPADVFRGRGGERRPIEPQPGWLRQPNPETTWFEFVEAINRALDLDGNAYIMITARDFAGFPAELWTLHPQHVEARRDGNRLEYVWEGTTRLSPYSASTPAGEVLHVRNFSDGGLKGLSPIGVARQAIGLALAAEKFGARFYGRGQTLSGVIELPATEPTKTKAYIDLIKQGWEQHHAGTDRTHLPGVLSGGAQWKPISIKPEEAQFLETRRFQVNEIARLYGVPPHMIGDVERSTSWGAGIEAQTTQFFITTIMTRLARMEAAFNQLTPRGQFIKWNANALLRGDARSRAEFYAKGVNTGWMVRNEVRALEDMPPIDGLDVPLIPGTMVPVQGGTDGSAS